MLKNKRELMEQIKVLQSKKSELINDSVKVINETIKDLRECGINITSNEDDCIVLDAIVIVDNYPKFVQEEY